LQADSGAAPLKANKRNDSSRKVAGHLNKC
jgi:hypothetical protein